MNAHVDWLNDIFGTGSHWGHQDRIKASSSDLGAQAAPLRLLLKDHKTWDKNSGNVIPSRPVVNGKSGYNSHLSEILSLIVGPIAKEAQGSEINSTGDLLSKVKSVNELLSNPSNHGQSNVDKQNGILDDDDYCDFCQKCNLPPPSERELKIAKNMVDSVSSKKVKCALNVSNNLRLKLKASRAATKLYHKCCQKPPSGLFKTDDQNDLKIYENRENEQFVSPTISQVETPTRKICQESPSYDKNFGHGEPKLHDFGRQVPDINIGGNSDPIITGFDVKALYPSLRDIDVACLLRESVIHSDIIIEGMDFQRALAYLINGGW